MYWFHKLSASQFRPPLPAVAHQTITHPKLPVAAVETQGSAPALLRIRSDNVELEVFKGRSCVLVRLNTSRSQHSSRRGGSTK